MLAAFGVCSSTAQSSRRDFTIREVAKTELSGLKEEWNALLATTEYSNVFQTWEWTHAWMETIGSKTETLLIKVLLQDELVGLAPLCFMNNGKSSGDVIGFCGSDILYPDYLDIIAAKGYESAVAESVLKYISTRWPGHQVRLDFVLQTSNVVRAISAIKSDYWICTNPIATSWTTNISDSYDGYLRTQFNKKERQHIRRRARRVFEEREISLKKIEQETEIDPALRTLFELHQKRKSATGVSSTFRQDSLFNFHSTLARSLLANNELWFYQLMDGELPVAAFYGFIRDNIVFSYQSGFAPELAELSLGTVLYTVLIEDAFKKNFRQFDFLQGDEEYKQKWTNLIRTEYRLQFYPKAIRFLLPYIVHRFVPVLKRLLRLFLTFFNRRRA